MADSITHNYEWIKPQVGASPTTWGNKINDDLDQIDAQMFAIDQRADSFVGEIKMYVGVVAPAKWKLCDGTVYDNADIPQLAPILNNAFGGVVGISNAMPDMSIRFPTGTKPGWADVGDTGGEATHTLVAAEMPSHGHTVSGSLTDPGHTHTVDDPGHSHGGRFGAGSDIVQNTPGTAGWFLDGVGGIQHVDVDNTGDASTNITLETNTTGATFAGGTAANTGGDGAHNNLPPYLVVNFIIKFET